MSSIAVIESQDDQVSSGVQTPNRVGVHRRHQPQQNSGQILQSPQQLQKSGQTDVKIFEDTMCTELAQLID